MLENVSRQLVLARRVVVANDPWTRMRGMLGRRFDDFDAMLFPRCRAIHMWFMHMALDVLFFDRDLRVVAWRRELRPWAMAAESRARHVAELPAGTLNDAQLAAGDLLRITAPQWREHP